jgi:hypothetical protein
VKIGSLRVIELKLISVEAFDEFLALSSHHSNPSSNKESLIDAVINAFSAAAVRRY